LICLGLVGVGAGSAVSGCGESDGDGKDCSSPLAAAAAPVAGEGAERQLVVWWRLPFKLIHYCAWKVRPVWSISIAAAFLGIVVLGRRVYRMRRKTTGLPQIKIALDEKVSFSLPVVTLLFRGMIYACIINFTSQT
jgi:hypothetical protein